MLELTSPIMRKESLEKVGIEIGHYTDKENLTGTTVFLTKKGADIGYRYSWIEHWIYKYSRI